VLAWLLYCLLLRLYRLGSRVCALCCCVCGFYGCIWMLISSAENLWTLPLFLHTQHSTRSCCFCLGQCNAHNDQFAEGGWHVDAAAVTRLLGV
jgi:hypothetical protein